MTNYLENNTSIRASFNQYSSVTGGFYWMTALGNNGGEGGNIGGNTHIYGCKTELSDEQKDELYSILETYCFLQQIQKGLPISLVFSRLIFNLPTAVQKTSLMLDPGLLFSDTKATGYSYFVADVNPASNTAILLTHHHLDHTGGIPFLLMYGYKLPTIYCSAITKQAVLSQLEAKGFSKSERESLLFIEIEIGKEYHFGNIVATPYPSSHSAAGACMWYLKTPFGTVLHTGDYKWDQTIKIGSPTSAEKLMMLRGEVTALMVDSTNAAKAGFAPEEEKVFEGMKAVLAKHREKRLIITMSGGDMQRLASICRLAADGGRADKIKDNNLITTKKQKREDTGKRVIVLAGAALKQAVKTLKKAGHDLREIYGVEIVADDTETAQNLKPHQTIILTTGTQGEKEGGLYKLACRDKKHVELRTDDVVIISKSVIPGNEAAFSKMMGKLQNFGITHLYTPSNVGGDLLLHASGHGHSGDVTALIALVSPKYVVPMHGNYQQLEAQANNALQMGHDHFFLPHNGAVVSISHENGLDVKQIRSENCLGIKEKGNFPYLTYEIVANIDSQGRETSTQKFNENAVDNGVASENRAGLSWHSTQKQYKLTG
ncbi:MAG: MBL fold metallo-hydrolase [Alphaproteobacteria bacterium]